MEKYSGSKIKDLVSNSDTYKQGTYLTQIVLRNNNLYEGKDVKTFFKAVPNLNFNYSKIIVDSFISNISDLNPKFYCKLFSKNNITEIEKSFYEQALNNYIEKTLTSNNNIILNLEFCRRACIDGMSFIHVSYDNIDYVDKLSNTDELSLSEGKLKLDVVDVNDVGVSNVNTYNLQDNDWISIKKRDRKESVKDLARFLRDNGCNTLSDEEIDFLGVDSYQDYLKGNYAYTDNLNNNNMIDIVLFYFKDVNTKRIHKKIIDLSSGIEICSDIDLELYLFPLANFNWSTRKNCYYGQSPLDAMEPIQTLINILVAAAGMQAILDIPRIVANQRKVNIRNISNDPSQIIATNSIDNVSNDIAKLQSSNQASSRFQFVSQLKQELMNIVGYNALDLSRITYDSSKSLIYAQEILNKPLANVKKMYSYSMISLARIIVDFYINYFKNDAVKTINIINKDGNEEEFPLDLSNISDVSYSFDVKYSASSVYSDDDSVSTLVSFIQAGLIQLQPEDFVKIIPENTLHMKDDLIQVLQKYNREKKQQSQEQLQQNTNTTLQNQEQPETLGLLNQFNQQLDNFNVSDEELKDLSKQTENEANVV